MGEGRRGEREGRVGEGELGGERKMERQWRGAVSCMQSDSLSWTNISIYFVYESKRLQ